MSGGRDSTDDGPPPMTAASATALHGLRRPAWPRLVRWTRWGAVAAAAAVLVGMFLTSPPSLTEPAMTEAGDVAREMAMRGPVLRGRLPDGRAYRLAADRATLEPGEGEAVLLDAVRGELELADGERLEIDAGAGRFEHEGERLALTGGVAAVRSDGYRLDTEAAVVWQAPEGLAARSDRPTAIVGPEGRAAAAGFVAAPGLDPVRLTGPVAVRLGGTDG